MSHDVKALVDQIRSLSPQLNEASDRMSAAFKTVEQFLSGCAIGVRAAVLFDDDAEQDKYENTTYTGTYLAYRRLSSEAGFRLCLEQAKLDGPGGDWEQTIWVKHWADTPREMRAAAFDYLPALLEQIRDEAKSLIERTSATDGTVTEILDAFGSQTDDGAPTLDQWQPPVTIAQVVDKTTRLANTIAQVAAPVTRCAEKIALTQKMVKDIAAQAQRVSGTKK